jgi:nickel-dependent lactate racemase
MTDEEIRNFLDNTVGSANIIEQAKGKKGRIVVTCDDLSRPTPAGRVFPFIVEQLHEAGVADHQIFIIRLRQPQPLPESRELGEDE